MAHVIYSLALTAGAFLLFFSTVTALIDLSDVVIVVRSQPNSYHVKRTKVFKKHINGQLEGVPKENRPWVYSSHETWPEIGSWTLLPLIPEFAEEFSSKLWLVICDEETRMDLSGLEKLLHKFDPLQEHFIGKALQDSQPVITHHFFMIDGDPTVFSYPDFAAGLIFSLSLIKRLASEWTHRPPRGDFTIDIQHEMAKFLWDDGNGIALTDVSELCAGEENSDCVTTYPQHFPQCGTPVPKEDLFVAVKTCEKFHKDRVPVVKKTWYKEAADIEFYSEKEDATIPTINLGMPNTERGHCGKTLAILKRFFNDPKKSRKPWLLIADDDTIISLPRLRELLACYDPAETVALGERYAFGVVNGYGYDYITGGGGMVFSRQTVNQLLRGSHCSCASNESPDDMTLGMCLQRLDIPVTHSPLFHQARPEDYSPKLLSHQRPVSFHKHWMVDPLKVYAEWFGDKSTGSRDEL